MKSELKINLIKRLKLKRMIVVGLITLSLAAEAIPEDIAKLVTVPALAGAILIEAIVGE